MATYTTTALLNAVRRYGQLPTYQEGATATLLALLNSEQLTYLTKQLEATREEYRTATLDVTLVAGQLEYQLPWRAVTAGLQFLQVVESGGAYWNLWELRPRDLSNYGPVASPCRRFYLKQNTIVFYGQPPTGTLRVWYPLRLSELIEATEGAGTFRTISTLNTSTKTLTLSGVFTNASGLCDLVQARPQFSQLAMDASFTGSGTSTLVFANSLPAGLAVGDYVTQPDVTPVCNAPWELHSLLAQHVAYVAQLMKGDPKAAVTKQLRDDTARDVLALLQPRPDRVRSVVNRQAPGFSRWGWGGIYRGGL